MAGWNLSGNCDGYAVLDQVWTETGEPDHLLL